MISAHEWMLARRYLRARGDERFVSLISWSSAMGVAIGVAALIVVLSVMYGFDVELKDRILGFSSHIDVQGPDNTLGDWRSWMKTSESMDDVVAALPYLSTQVLANRGSASSGAILKGVLPEREQHIASQITAGRFLRTSKDIHFEVVMGKDLARKLGLNIGDQVRLLSPAGGISPAGMSPRMRAFTLVGVFESGFYEYDIGMILAPLTAVQRLERTGDRITGIELMLRDREQASVIAKKLQKILPLGAWITDWRQRNRSFFHALEMERVVMGIILSLIVLVAVFNMISSLVMVVMQRRKEIAVFKTLGATHASVMRVFLTMGALLSGLGTLVGAVLGLLLAWKLDVILATFERITHIKILSKDVYYIDHVPSIIDPVSVAIIVTLSFVLGIAATFYPAWRAAGVPPAEALRYE